MLIMERKTILKATLMRMVRKMRKGMVLAVTPRWWLFMQPSRLCSLASLRRWDKRWKQLQMLTNPAMNLSL